MNKGFTLIELMVTLAVLAIVVAVAAPSFNSLISKTRSERLGGDLASAINLARSEAIKRSGRVSICSSTDGLACADNDDWVDGWIVFVDGANADSADTATVVEVLRFWGDVPAGSAVTASNGVTFLRFVGSGMMTWPVGNVTFNAQASGCKGNSAQSVAVGIAGMMTASKIAC